MKTVNLKKTFLLIIILLTFAGIANAQKSKLIGSWLMTKVEIDSTVEKPFFITEFNDAGKMVIMGMEIGTWHYNENSHTILMESEFDKDFNGEGKILSLTENELVVNKDGAKLYYQKINMAKITESNKNSGLIGVWEFKDVPEMNMFVTFKEPDEFTIIQKEENIESRLSGTWIFDKQKMSLIMIGLRGEDMLKGENKVVKIDEETMELNNNGIVFEAKKKAQNTTKIERLEFTENDFYNEDGEYKYYDEEEKLPWRNWAEMKMNLLEVNQLVYNYSTLINGTKIFENKILTAEVQASLEEEGFSIDNIFNGYDRYNLPEDSEFPQDTDFSRPLYPLKDNTFRLIGNEQITTLAGTFDCNVLEVIGNSGVRKKLWMITDKIGIYAKIIEDDPDESFGHYYIYELKEIK